MVTATLELRFPVSEIPHWAHRYSYDGEDDLIRRMGMAKARGHLTREEFLALCKWKTPRSQPLCRRNKPQHIRDVTSNAFHCRDEKAKMAALRTLDGVGWPTASVLLHFCDRGSYPILDYRALWSLGLDRPPSSYTFDFWWAYTEFSRGLARTAKCDMRTLDRALWQFSKEQQGKPSA